MPDQMDLDDEDMEAFASLWGKRAEGLSAPNIDITRPVTPSDVAYLVSRCPYIQILNIDATFENYTSVHFVTAKSGWIIQDLDDGLCSALGGFLFGGTESFNIPTEIDNELLTKYVNAGKGTIINQAFDTAHEMVELIKDRWKGGIEIIAGTELMKWAIWVVAEEYKLKLIGYDATAEDKKKRDRLNRLAAQKAIAPKPKNR